MPVRRESSAAEVVSALRVSGLILRRAEGKEFHSYIPMLDYHVGDYEVLLRYWGSEPYSLHLGGFSGPMIAGEDPEETLLTRSSDWTKNLANKAGLTNYKPLRGHKVAFLSVHGGGHPIDPVSGQPVELGLMLCYVVPLKQSDSSIISQFPPSPEYPKFYNLGEILYQMVRGSVKIHPYTREMLSSLDHWLREQHAVPGAINCLFAPSLKSRMKMFVVNPLFLPSEPEQQTPNHSLVEEGVPPLLSSTPFNNGLGEDSTLFGTTAMTLPKLGQTITSFNQHLPVDMIVKNPLFGSGLCLKKVNMQVVNEYFGCGEPNYSAIGESSGKWLVQVQSDGLPDWTELFPLHKFCCEGSVEGVRRCLKNGMTADERDIDTWSPLHYACWYGELEVVKVLVEEASATIGIQNSSGASPLHLAASNGHASVVSYLLKQRAGQRIKAALDNDGKSALAMCLESKSNDWNATAQLLRDAYKSPTPLDSFPPSLLPYSPLPSSAEDLTVLSSGSVNGQEELELMGSRGNLTDPIYPVKSPRKTRKNSKSQETKPVRTIRRQRVNFGLNQHQVAHFFDGKDTTCKDVINDLYRLVKLPQNFQCVFALWISSKSLELQLGDIDQPLKIMYSWKKLLSQYSATRGEGEVPNFHLWRNVFFPASGEKMITDPTVLEFLYADAHRHVLNSHYPCSEEDLYYLAGITLQITYGDYNELLHGPGFLRDKLGHVLPSHMMASKRRVEFERRILAKYAEISQFRFEDMKFLFQHYLKHCWQWSYYGATFYEGVLHTKGAKLEIEKLPRRSQLPIHIGINTGGFHLINLETNTLLASIGFDGLDWDVSTTKQELIIFNRNKTVFIPIYSRKVSLLYSLATKMRELHLE